MQSLIAERGYVVMKSSRVYRPGEIIESPLIEDYGVRPAQTKAVFSIIAKTDIEDYLAQGDVLARLGMHPSPPGSHKFYYRINTD